MVYAGLPGARLYMNQSDRCPCDNGCVDADLSAFSRRRRESRARFSSGDSPEMSMTGLLRMSVIVVLLRGKDFP